MTKCTSKPDCPCEFCMQVRTTEQPGDEQKRLALEFIEKVSARSRRERQAERESGSVIGETMKKLVFILLCVSAMPALSSGQTLTLDNVKLTLGMSKAEVFSQAAFVSQHSTGNKYTTAQELPDAELVTVFRTSDYCMTDGHARNDCIAEVAFIHSRLSYASKSVYSGSDDAAQTLHEVIGGVLSTCLLSANKHTPASIAYATWHNDAGVGESVIILCGARQLSIDTSPMKAGIAGPNPRTIGNVEESVGQYPLPK